MPSSVTSGVSPSKTFWGRALQRAAISMLWTQPPPFIHTNQCTTDARSFDECKSFELSLAQHFSCPDRCALGLLGANWPCSRLHALLLAPAPPLCARLLAGWNDAVKQCQAAPSARSPSFSADWRWACKLQSSPRLKQIGGHACTRVPRNRSTIDSQPAPIPPADPAGRPSAHRQGRDERSQELFPELRPRPAPAADASVLLLRRRGAGMHARGLRTLARTCVALCTHRSLNPACWWICAVLCAF